MKKTLIAGAASAMLAAMPVVGVFAVGNGETFTDNFTVNIERQCTMTRKATAHGNGYNNTAWNPTDTTSDLMNIGTVTSGAVYSLGSSSFNVKCNGTDGYRVNAVITNFTNAAGDTIGLSNAEITTAPTTASVWSIYNGSSYITADGIVKNSGDPTANAGEDLTMTYNLGLKDGQASGTYNANVAYTLYDLTD